MPSMQLPTPRELNHSDDQTIQRTIDLKTKPQGSLGQLEQVAFKLAKIGNGTPSVKKPTMVVFAGDHGAAESGISPFPQAVTRQMVMNFLGQGAAINVFAKQSGMELWVVDAGVVGSFEWHPYLLDRKVAEGTRNYLNEPAMTESQLALAINHGRDIVKDLYDKGVNTIGLGEMGIGNTSSASLLMHAITGTALGNCVGRGTGLDDEGLVRKKKLLEAAVLQHGIPKQPLEVLRTYGGFEIAMMTGAFAQAAHLGMLVIVDGFIASSAFLVAWSCHSSISNFAVFSHCSAETGHKLMLDQIGEKPLLDLGLRLGEGTGAALALPLIQASANFYNQMASFEQAGVSNRDA